MNDLIKINTGSGSLTVTGRGLHKTLGIQTHYKKWFDRMCEYGFSENLDFVTLSKIGKRADKKRTTNSLKNFCAEYKERFDRMREYVFYR